MLNLSVPNFKEGTVSFAAGEGAALRAHL